MKALKDEKHLPLLLVKGKPPEGGHAVPHIEMVLLVAFKLLLDPEVM